MNPHRARRLFENLAEAIPDPVTELNFSNNFELLVAVILSAQATDVGVNKATPGLFARFPGPSEMAAAEYEEILEEIRTIGLAPSKARNLMKTAAILAQTPDRWPTRVPENREELEALPGVGRKTANVVLNTAFGHEAIAVDTHVFRVSARTGLSTGKNVLQTERDLMTAVPKKYLIVAHHYLVLHGRYVCKAQRPLCAECPIQKQCDLFTSGGAEEFLAAGTKTARKQAASKKAPPRKPTGSKVKAKAIVNAKARTKAKTRA